jgi:hypothetical protein
MVQIFKKCQDTIGTGYLMPFPVTFFDDLEALKPNYVRKTILYLSL